MKMDNNNFEKNIQKIQEDFDKKYWEHNGELEKVRHITLHMGKLLGKLSSFCESREHGIQYSAEEIKKEVIPDLVIYAAQLANLFCVNLYSRCMERIEENILKRNK